MDVNEIKKLIKALGFGPKENFQGISEKVYAGGYAILVDFEKQIINYGNKIQAESKTTQNFSQPENFVVLECVDRLLEKGYRPENIILEKTYRAGRGKSDRLDICVTHDDGSEYLLIECKTYGKEFDRELANMKKDGGQLFTYFKFTNKPDLLMLYASELKGQKIVYRNEIVKIEDGYRTGDVKDFYKKWNKSAQDNGVFEKHIKTYNFNNEPFTKRQLKELTEDEGKKLFHGFATILRKHSVSDKPNAFNVIFNLFLAKLYDEQKRNDQELEFQWKQNDDPVDFQVRLYNLHKEGLFDFLKKEIEGINDKDFENKSGTDLREAKKKILKINKHFDIKNVLDDDSFIQNHRVLLEVVMLLQKYQIRYPRKQKYLSEFFELLLTTGLKQEVGQYFTPPPVAKFIVKSLPLAAMVEQAVNQPTPSLPAAIDYAAGSGHFITEILEEYQDIIEKLDAADFYPKTQKVVNSWKADQYNWAASYVYGIEKDYRLVKVAKVGCYFYGDGLAQVIHGDGLDSFEKSTSYVGLLKDNAKKPQFSVLVSNPPYSVDYIKDDMEYIGVQDDFKLFKNLTDNSSEIEALFVERTAQLLKVNGVAGIILPSTILSNSGIYAKAREIILQYFDIVAITQLSGNTFMATNTNTVILFLRKRDMDEIKRIESAAYNLAEDYAKTGKDLTINGIEKPARKYLDYTGETEVDPEKFYYFVLNYRQKAVIVKTGEKDAEKLFLGYEFSNRRGGEGIHPIQRGKTIDECTKLYDDCENKTKANFYISKAFNNNFPKIHDSLKDNVFYVNLVDMLTFDREKFDKNISLMVKKKIEINSKWGLEKLGKISKIIRGVTYSKDDQTLNKTNKIILTADNITLNGYLEIKKQVYLNNNFDISDEKKLKANDIFVCFSSGSKEHLGKVAFIKASTNYYAGGFMGILRVFEDYNSKYIYLLLNTVLRQSVRDIGSGSNINNLSSVINNIKIPLPPKEIQQKIVTEIEVLEKNEEKNRKEILKYNEQIHEIINNLNASTTIKCYFEVNTATINPTVKWENEYFTYVDIDSVGKGNGYVDFNQKILGKDAPSRARRLAKNKTAVISTVRPYLKSFAFLDSVPEKTIFSTGFALLNSISENKYITKFIYLLFMFSDDLMKQIKNVMPKSAYPSINVKDIENFKIPLPPISEQQKIVSKIERLETQIAEAQKTIDEMPAAKNEVLKKYLSA
ncbi:MAG: N-6 DNA methylase [Chitinispirillia bacterium]|nr:N-6 DNA methylase [Chitinispirillia bacterium]MCL2241631.1 N-6 DNA methylase [Chitinispirillia bacterium]